MTHRNQIFALIRLFVFIFPPITAAFARSSVRLLPTKVPQVPTIDNGLTL